MTPEEVEEDVKGLNRIRAKNYRAKNPKKVELSFLASGGTSNPTRVASRKKCDKVHRIKNKLIREFIGEEKYFYFLGKAKEDYEVLENTK